MVTRRTQPQPVVDEARAMFVRRMAEAVFLIVLVVAVYLMLALVSHSSNDPGWTQSASADSVSNIGGPFGAWISDIFLMLFGHMAYAAPVLLGVGSARVLQEKTAPATLMEWAVRSGGLALVVLSGCILFHLQGGGGLDRKSGV